MPLEDHQSLGTQFDEDSAVLFFIEIYTIVTVAMENIFNKNSNDCLFADCANNKLQLKISTTNCGYFG